ncbi:hypothetical protein AAC387_Pa08g0427 [Persea americana]
MEDEEAKKKNVFLLFDDMNQTVQDRESTGKIHKPVARWHVCAEMRLGMEILLETSCWDLHSKADVKSKGIIQLLQLISQDVFSISIEGNSGLLNLKDPI